jgi:hypothetical protein
MTSRVALPALAALTFIAGFGLAELTGVRALGGLVLLAGGVLCARIALRLAGPGATVALLAVALALFVLSHPLGHAVGAWPAVVVSASLTAATAVLVTHMWRKTDAQAVGSRIAPGGELADDRMRGGLGPDRR